MQTWTYPAKVVEFEPGDFVVTFPDVPGATTGAPTQEEALALAADALEEAILGYLAHDRVVPNPRPARKGEFSVPLDPATAARVILTRAMAEQRLSNVALAARMDRNEKVIRRVLSGKGASLDLILKALSAVGVHPTLAA
jgi:antitoxin HicB